MTNGYISAKYVDDYIADRAQSKQHSAQRLNYMHTVQLEEYGLRESHDTKGFYYKKENNNE